MDDRLFPDEGPDGFESTARMWLAVYTELAGFLRSAMTEGGHDDHLRTERLAQCERRAAYWTGELARLEAARPIVDPVQPPAGLRIRSV